MPSKFLQRNFKPKHYYHVFNRGGFKQKIFRSKKDYDVFLDILKYYLRFPTIVSLSRLSDKKFINFKKKNAPKAYSLIAYCLMPNHFHLLLRQNLVAPTLTDFLKKISVTYAMYFQYRYKHSGALFAGRFRCVSVFDDEQLLYLTKYIHLNPKKTVGSVPTDFIYSSLRDYLHLNKKSKDWLNSKTIFDKFFYQAVNAPADYLKFLSTKEDEKKLIKLLKQKTLE